MKKLLLFFALCSSLGAWAQSVVKSVDGSTLTLTCTGNVTDMPDALAPTGNKLFTAAAKEGNQYGKVLKIKGDMSSYPNAGESCASGTSYYLKVYNYSEPTTPTIVESYSLLQNVYKFDGASTYTLKEIGSSVDADGSYWILNGDEVAIVDEALNEYKGEEAFTQTIWQFSSNDNGWRWQGSAVSAGASYDATKYYSVAQYDLPFLTYDELKEQGYLGSSINDPSKELYIKNADNSYTIADGKLFNSSLNYVKGLSFAKIEDITSSSYSSRAQFVKTADPDPDKTWRKKVLEGEEYVYYMVNDMDPYDASAVYVHTNGATASTNPLTMSELEEYGFIEDEYASTDFWTAMGREIFDEEYTKVILKSGSSTKAIISDDVVNKILFASTSPYNKSLLNLDLGDVVLPGVNAKSFDPSDDKYMLKSTSLCELTLPLVPAVDGTVTVPSNVLECATQNEVLLTVHVPEGYTAIGSNAFSGLEKIQTITLPTTLKEIGNSAFENSGSITAMTLNGGLEYIGKSAFVGTSLTYNTENPFSIPSSVKKIDQLAFANVKNIAYVQFNNGLEYIGNSAFISDSELKEQLTLVFPNTVKYIGPGAFVGRMYKDVFFTSQTAPICPIGKPLIYAYELTQCATFSPNLYHGNNGFDADEEDGGDDARHHGYANRQNYINGGDFLAFLHFPTGLNDDNRNTYRDIQRIYKTYPAGHRYAYDDPDGFDYNTVNAGGITVPGASADEPERWQGTEHTIGGNILPPGFVDTYRGEQYVWPSQPMWARAFIENAYGYQYDGVTKYRPTITTEQIGYMIEDGLVMSDGVTLTDGTIEMTQDQVNAYNATLEGAWNEETIKTPAVYYTQEECDEHNADVEGTIKVGDPVYYTKDEIDAYNANLTGAVKVGDVQTEGSDWVYYSWAEYIELHPDAQYQWQSEAGYNSTVEWAVGQYTNGWDTYSVLEPYVKKAKADPVLYDAESAALYNANLPEAWEYNKAKSESATQDEVNIYNASIEGAWTTSTVKEEAVYYTATEINEHNAALIGAKSVGATMSNLDYYADEIKKIAYLGTREFVFSDPDTDPGTTPNEKEIPGITSEHWWTLCVPFNMTKKMINETFGPGTHVCRLNKIERDVTSTPKRVKFYFQDDVYVHKSVKDADGVYTRDGGSVGENDIVIYAHEAYMIYPTENQNDQGTFVVKNYQMVTGAPIPTILEANADDNSNEDHTEYRYIGNYTQEIVSTDANGVLTTTTAKIPAYSYMYAKKKNDSDYKFWFTSSNNVTWKPFKCVIQATAKDGGAKENYNFFGGANPDASKNVKQISIFGENDDLFDSEETDIESVEFIMGEGKDSETIYNINGQMVNPSTLQKGIYIKNGKKYLVK